MAIVRSRTWGRIQVRTSYHAAPVSLSKQYGRVPGNDRIGSDLRTRGAAVPAKHLGALRRRLHAVADAEVVEPLDPIVERRPVDHPAVRSLGRAVNHRALGSPPHLAGWEAKGRHAPSFAPGSDIGAHRSEVVAASPG